MQERRVILRSVERLARTYRAASDLEATTALNDLVAYVDQTIEGALDVAHAASPSVPDEALRFWNSAE